MRVATFLFVLLTIFSGALVIAEADAYRVSRSGSEVNFVAEPTEQNALDVLTWKDFSHSNRNRRHSRDRIVGEQVTHEIGADEWILFSDRLAQLDSSPITGRCVAGRFGSTHMSVACPLTGVRRVVVRLGDEDDIVSAAHEFAAIELPMDIYGGAGQDFIIGGKLSDRIFTGEEAGWRDLGDSEGLFLADFAGGAGGADQIYGDSGQDFLFGGPGNDSVYGEQGDDRVAGGTGNDRVLGGDGNDFLEGTYDTQVFLTMEQAANRRLDLNPGCRNWNDCSVLGGVGTLSSGRDYLEGGNDQDSVSYGARTSPITVNLQSGEGGANGEDSLRSVENVIGGGGDDQITGGTEANSIEGGPGNDTIHLEGDNKTDNVNCDEGEDDTAFLDFGLDTSFQCEGGLYSGGCEGATVSAPFNPNDLSQGSHRVSACLLNPAHPFTREFF